MSADTPLAPEQGNLSIHAENILPIIKKWLYSDHEIFLRELVSNAVDAVSKLRHVALTEGLGELGEFRIDVDVDKDAKTITVRDNGIGMSAEEVRKYINQVAFSGAKDFVERYQVEGEGNGIIGHFGLGFYSAFMVADKVEIRTKSYKADEPACHWSCEGGLAFSLEPDDRETRGTDIVLHLSADAAEFLEEIRLQTVLNKYCKYLPVPIHLNGTLINDQAPIWSKSPSSLSDQDYLDFFHQAYPYEDDPLFWIHLNVDYPFTLQGVLYFPKLKHEMDASKASVQLYCNNVFVSDNTQDVMPRFLSVLKGMIDCPEIPLNVSRSMLQNDPYVRKIAGHITKKVADRLTQLFRSQRDKFEGYWQDIHPFVKFGMLEDDKFAEAVKDVVIFKSTKGDNVTVPEYLARNAEKAAGKVFYAETGDTQATYLKLFEAEGLEAVYTQGLLDAHFIHYLESKDREVRWVRVDAAAKEHLVADDDGAKIVDAEGKTVDERLKAIAEAALADKGVEIDVQSLKRDDVSGLITQNENERRMNDMAAMWKGQGIEIPVRKTLLLNANSAVVKKLLDTPDPAAAKELAEHVYDLARLAHEGLQGDDLAAFIARSHKLLGG